MTVPVYHHTAYTVRGNGRQQLAKLPLVDHFFVFEAELQQRVAALAQCLQFGLCLGNFHLARTDEAAVVVNQFMDAMPRSESRDGQGNFRQRAAESANAAGIGAGGVATDAILLHDDDR